MIALKSNQLTWKLVNSRLLDEPLLVILEALCVRDYFAAIVQERRGVGLAKGAEGVRKYIL
jgi:hypothetical protein